MEKKKDYISLKEAGKLSGYSADYVGQLIRAGKLPGKQVFSNVSWVTTEEAIAEYMRKEKGDAQASFRLGGSLEPKFLLGVYSALTWICVGIFIMFSVVLLYIFSIGIESRINHTYLEDALKREAAK